MKQGETIKELFGGAVDTTNNKMELQADVPIEIYSDSSYVIQGYRLLFNWTIQ